MILQQIQQLVRFVMDTILLQLEHLIIDKIIPALLNRMKLKWSDLPSNLVAQLVFFTMRFVSRNNSKVGPYVNGYIINENGWHSYSLEKFFPLHFDENKKMEYIYEILETVLKTIDSNKINEGFDIELIFTILGEYYSKKNKNILVRYLYSKVLSLLRAL